MIVIGILWEEGTCEKIWHLGIIFVSQQLSEWFMYTISADPLYHSKQILSSLYIRETKPCRSYLIKRKIMSSELTYVAKSTRIKKKKKTESLPSRSSQFSWWNKQVNSQLQLRVIGALVGTCTECCRSEGHQAETAQDQEKLSRAGSIQTEAWRWSKTSPGEERGRAGL